MSRYSPRRQDGSTSRAYPDQTTTVAATSRPHPLSTRSFGTADNSPSKTYKRNSPLTERGSPVSGASSFSAGRLSSSSRKNDTAETSGESPAKVHKASGIPQANSINRDGTPSSHHTRTSSRLHQDNTLSKLDSLSSSEYKHAQCTTDSNLPSLRRKSSEDAATKKEFSRIGPRTEDPATKKESSRIAPRTEDPATRKESSRIAPRSLGRGNSESPSRSPQDSDGGSPSNIPLRPSPKRGVEGDKNSDQGASRLLRTSARPRAASGMIGAGSAIDEVKPLSTRTPKDLKLGDPTNRQAPSVNKTDKSPRVKSSPDGVRSPSSGSPNKEAESVNMTANSKTGSKIGELSKASSPSRKLEGTSSKQTFDRGDIKYNSCRSRIPTPNSPSGSRKGSESPVRQKLSSHSFTAPRTGEPANRTSPDEGCPPKETPESRAERIARYKDIRRKELASKIKYKADPETDPEPESVNISKTLNEEKPKTSKQTDIVTESSTAAKTNAARSATADSSKIICGMKVSKNIADRAKKRQERMLRNSQHLSAELIGRRAKISAVCSKLDTEGSETHQTGESDLLRPEAGPGQSSNQLQLSPSREMDLLSPGSLSVSGSDRDSTYLQLTSESSDLSPDDKRLSLTELESLPETRSSSDELNLPTEHGMVDSLCISEPSPSYEDVPNVREPIKSSESPLEEFVVAKKPDSLDLRLTTTPKIQCSSIEDSPENYTATSSCNLYSSSPESRISKLSSGNTFKDSRIPDLSSGLAATTTKEALNKENNPVTSPFEKVLRKVKSPPRSGIPDSSLSPVLSNIGENRNPKREEGNNDQPKVQTSPAWNFPTSLSSDRIGEKVRSSPGGRLTDANISSVSTGVTDKGRRVVSEPDVESDDYTPKTPYKISQDNDRYSPPKTNEDNTPFRGIKGMSEPDVQRDNYISKSSIKAKDSSYSYSPPKTKEDNAPFRGIKGMSEPDVPHDDYISKTSIKAKDSSYSYSPPKTKEDNTPFRGIKGMSEPDVQHEDYISKNSIKAKGSSYSYSPPKTKEDNAPFQAKLASVVTDNQTEGPAKLSFEKSRPRPPPSTVLYTKKLLESGSVKKDQKRIDYDLQKELDWLEHRKYQYADDSDEQKEKKLSVLEMVRAAEGKADTDEEKPRKPLGRTMSEARGRDATQSRKEILANRISNLGRTRSFALNSNRRAEPSAVADEAPLPMRESNLDELLMKNVAYLDDENVPKDPAVRSLHPAENLKLRKSLRKKKVAKHMSLPETGTSEEKRSFSKSESIKELGSAATELAASRATLKLKEHDPSSSKVQNVDSSNATSPFAKSPTSGVTPNSNKKISPKHDVTQKPLHGTNPVTNVTQTSKNLPGTRSIATNSVSPTAAASYKASDVHNKGLPSPEYNVTTAVPEQVDVRDSPHRKRIRSRSRGRPTAENIVDPAKRRRDKSGPRTSRLGALEENTDTKSASPHQELSPPEFPTTETSTALHSFENSNASTRPKPASTEGAPPPRRSRQRIRPEDIPAPIRDVIKASLGYEQDGTQPKAEPSRSAEIAQLQGTFRISDAQRAGPQTAVQGNSAEETIKEFEEFAPVMSRRLSDTNKSTITTIKNPRINPDSVSIQKQGQPSALKTRANSLDSATITASPKIAYNIRKFSLAENNNTSKVLPFHSNDWNSADNLASSLAPIKESRQSSEKSVSHRDAEEAEKGLGLSEGTATPSEPLAGLDRNHFSSRSGRAEDKSKAPAEDLTDVKLVVREDSNHGNKNREAVESAQSLNFQSTSRISLASKPGEQTSSQVRKPNVTRPDGDYSGEKVLSTEPDKPELSSSPGTSTTTHTPLETTVAQNRTTISGSSEISVTPSVPVTSDIVATSTLSAGSDTVVPSTPAKSDTVVSSTPSATRDTVVSSSSSAKSNTVMSSTPSATSDASLSEVTEVPVTSKQVRNTTTGSVTMPVSVTSEAPSNAKLTPHVTEVISSSPVSQNPIGTNVTSSENVTLKPTVANVTKNTVTNVTKPGVTEERKPIVTNDIKPAVTDETRSVTNVTQPAVTNVTKPGVTEERKPIVTNVIKPAVTDETSVATVTQPAVTNVTKPALAGEQKPTVTNVTRPSVTNKSVTKAAVANVTKPTVSEKNEHSVTNAMKPTVTDETKAITKPAVTNVTVTEQTKSVTNLTNATVTDQTKTAIKNVTKPTVSGETEHSVTNVTKPAVTNATVTDQTKSVTNTTKLVVTNATKPAVTDQSKAVTKPAVTDEIKHSVTNVAKPPVTNATVTDQRKPVTNATVTDQTKAVANATKPTVTDQTNPVTKPAVTDEIKHSVTNVTKPAVTNATVTDQTKPVTNATKPAVTDQTKAVTKPVVTDEIKHSNTNVTKPAVTNTTVTKPVTTEDQKPIVTPTSKAPIKNIISNTPATVTTVTTSAMPVSTNSINLGQTSPVMTAPVSSNVNSPTITTISQNTNVTKTNEKTSPREEKTVTTPTSDLKNNSVSKLVTSTPTSTLSTGMTNQSPKTPNSSTAPNLRSVSLSPTLPESQDLSRSQELTPKDIENGNVMTQSAQFSQPRMSEGSISVPRRGILKRSSSLRSNNVNNELIDPELAVVFQARRIKEKSENPTSDDALDEKEEEDEDDSAFSGKFQGSDSLLSEIMAESEESGEKPLSVAERISKMETKISISTSGCTTPKTPRSRLGSVARTLSEQESKKSVLSQEELFNKLTDLARSKEASQECQKRYHRSRDDWRTRTQPVTLKEVEQADRQTLADKVKLFSSEREVTQDKPNRTDAPVIRRRNRRFASRFSTQPITTEEMENVFRISPLAISLVKPPDPDILKGLPLNAQRELIAQYAETCLSQQGSRAGSRAGSRPGSLAGSRRGSIEESEDSKAETKGILKMADYQKDLQQVKSILKSESGRDSPEREIKSILKADADRKDNEPSRSILKQDSNEQVQGETRSILKSSSEPEPRRSSKQLDSEPRGILKSSETMETSSVAPKTSEPKSALKKDSHLEKNGTEPRGILKKESSFDCKKEPEKGVLKHSDSKDGKEVPCQDGLQGILKKESSIENLTSEDSDIGDVLTTAEKQLAPGVGEGKKKEYRRGSDERYLTQPVTEVEKKSPESPRKLQRYGSRQHKTQPITPEEKKEATQVIQPVVKMSGSLAERLQALQKSGEEDWKKRLSKHSNSPSPSPDRELRLSSPETTPVRPANLSERMSLLRSSQTSWRSRVEESDAKAFTVEGKLSKSGQMTRERSVVTKVKQTVKCTDPDQLNSATSPTTPTKGEWKIPIPKEIIVSETTSLEETSDHSPTIVKLPELKDDGLDQFFGSSPNLFDKSELLDISVDDFDEIFQTSQNILIHSVKARPKKKVQARSKNPLKSRSANLERQEYEEYKTNVAEMELKRIKKEALSKDAGFAEAALAGLASKENFSKIELRKTDTSVPSPGGNRYLPYKPLMLLHIKGRRHVQTRLVEPCCRNVNLGDCYVLVTPEKVINWIGEYSNIIEKAKSADIAAHIQQKKDMGFKASSGVITIDSRKTSGSVFWSLLDGHESECQECGGADEDEIYENAIISTNMVYQIEKNRLVPFEEYWGGLPRYEMLKSHQVFVFDFGAEVYIWQGKKAVPQRRRLGMELAQQLFDKGYNYEMSSINPLSPLQGVSEGGSKGSSSQRPSWSLIAKVNENMETVLFREKFADWPDSARLIKVKSVDSNSNKTDNGDLIPYDAQKLIEKKIPEALLMTLDGSQVGRGTYWSEDMGGFIQEFEINTLAVTVWHILEFDHYRLDPLSNGQFHDGDTYVVRWEYRIVATGAKGGARRSAAGRERCAYFFWQGQTSTITEKGASALMTVELDEERGPQVRVLQGKEPPCFLNLFQGQMVVHIGKREEEETNTQGAWRFYALRNEKRNEMCLIEIDAQISSLRSRSSFILFNTQSGKVYVWHGAKSPQNTRKLAVEAVNLIEDRHPLEMGLAENIHVNITEMNEGSEKPEFWMALRSRDRSRYVSLLNDPRSYNVSLRLFQFTSVSGVIEVTEIRNPTITPDHLAPYPFLQSDLYKVSQPALFLLDCGYEVYLWQGWWPEGDEEIENVLTGSAQSRLMIERRCAMQTAVDYCQAKNVSTPIKPFLVFAGLEPLKFTNIFPFWNIDHTAKELSLKDGKIDGDLVSVEDELNRLSLVRYSFKELLERPLPEDVDPLKLESYLSDQEFEDVLKMTRSEYYELPTWKQSKLKQDIGLF